MPAHNHQGTHDRVAGTVRLTMAQALIKYLMAQQTEIGGEALPLIPAIWAIFGHGNVAGLGEALYQVRDKLPTLRAHNEQGMAHAAIAFAKAKGRKQMMACTTSIGPGATNMVTAAGLAHSNRLPVLFLPGDTFATRAPDPVLQQIEDFGDATISVNDCFKPVSRFWDRISRPEQLLTSLPRAIQVLTDPANCGPVTLALPQDVQAMAWDYPSHFFEPRLHYRRRPMPDPREIETAVELLRSAKKPFIIAGGGVHYSDGCDALNDFASRFGIPVAETQAGKGALRWDHPNNVGAIGVTGSSAANDLAKEADVVLAIGTRLQDFTTASRSLFEGNRCHMIGLNVAAFDAGKHGSVPLVGDAVRGLQALSSKLAEWRAPQSWSDRGRNEAAAWNRIVDEVTEATSSSLPTDAQVVGVVNRFASDDSIVVCAAGGLPGELHKLWRTAKPKGYHVEYGYSCMGYEIAGGIGAKMALPDRDVYVMVGDGSYLMLNSEIATSVTLGLKLIIVVLNNHGFACINRLQRQCGGKSFNNLFQDFQQTSGELPAIDFAAHAASLGALSENVDHIDHLENALQRAIDSPKTYVVVIETDPVLTAEAGGSWWDVAVPEISESENVRRAHADYLAAKQSQSKKQ